MGSGAAGVAEVARGVCRRGEGATAARDVCRGESGCRGRREEKEEAEEKEREEEAERGHREGPVGRGNDVASLVWLGVDARV
jgi:hypothetical protein